MTILGGTQNKRRTTIQNKEKGMRKKNISCFSFDYIALLYDIMWFVIMVCGFFKMVINPLQSGYFSEPEAKGVGDLLRPPPPQKNKNPQHFFNTHLILSGPRFFRYRKDRGGGGFHPPFDSSENWWVEYSICTYATIKFF